MSPISAYPKTDGRLAVTGQMQKKGPGLERGILRENEIEN